MSLERLASLCDEMGWELELDPHWHDREGWLTVRTPVIHVGHTAAGETWDRAAERVLEGVAA